MFSLETFFDINQHFPWEKSKHLGEKRPATSRVESHLNGSRVIKRMLICSEMHVTELAFTEEKGLVNYTEIKSASSRDS